MNRPSLLVLLFVGACSPNVGDASPPIDAGPPVVFSRDIRPVVNNVCGRCHIPNVAMHAGYDAVHLDVSTLGSIRRGGLNTQRDIIVPYDPTGSAIVQKLRGTFPIGQRMPRNSTPLPEADIETIERWIAQGAQGDDDE